MTRKHALNAGVQSGASILTVLVALGIAGILATISASYFKNSLEASNIVRDRNHVEDLRRLVRVSVNCGATVASRPKNCPEGTSVELAKGVKKPASFVSKKGTKFGDYELSAECGAAPHLFVVKYRRQQQAWSSLFPPDVPLACRGD